MIIADTNVVSEPLRSRPDDNVIAWLAHHRHDTALTSISAGELRFGVLRLPAGERQRRLHEAVETLLSHSRERIYAYDLLASQSYAELRVARETVGRPVDDSDLMIAAIARSRGYPIATRNTRHFEGLGIEVINPWQWNTDPAA